MRLPTLWPVLLSVALLAGCNSPDGGGLIHTGHYQGNLIRRGISGLSEAAVQADITQPDSRSWLLAVRPAGNTPSSSSPDQDSITLQSDGSLALTIPSLGIAQAAVPPGQGCYVSSDNPQIQVCAETGALLIEVRDATGPVYSLSLQASDNAAAAPVEVPAQYTLDQAMDRTFSTSFETRAQFERSMQASHEASNAYQNLLPRLNINTVTAIASAFPLTTAFNTLTNLMSGIGDLVPFLLPTRWIAAENASLNSDAEQIALWVMRGDSGLEVESLAYSWISDGLVIGDYTQIIAETQALEKQIRFLERMGEYPQGTADTLQTSIDGMQIDVAALSAARDDKKALLAQAMGFVSPEAVTAITLDSSTPPEDTGLDLDQLQEGPFEDAVVSRSPELQQTDKLVEIAKNSKTSTYFDWLDPSGDPNASLGAGYGTSVEIAQDKVNELELQRTQLEATLRQKARGALDDYQTARSNVELNATDLKLQQKRVADVLETIKYGKDTNQVELATVYQDLLRAMIGERVAEAAAQVARAKIDRLMLEGYYSKLAFAPAVTPRGPSSGSRHSAH